MRKYFRRNAPAIVAILLLLVFVGLYQAIPVLANAVDNVVVFITVSATPDYSPPSNPGDSPAKTLASNTIPIIWVAVGIVLMVSCLVGGVSIPALVSLALAAIIIAIGLAPIQAGISAIP